MPNAILFLLGVTSVTAVYKIAMTGKRAKSDKIQRKIENSVKSK